MTYITQQPHGCNTDLFGGALVPQNRPEYPHRPGFKEATTSMQAAMAVASHAKTVRAAVLSEYVAASPDGRTPDEIAATLNESILTVRPRCAELKRLGMIEPIDETRPNTTSGHNARVMRATWKAIDGRPV